MSTEGISQQMDAFSITSAVVGIGKTREEYLRLFSRACISPLNDRPYVTPISGLYDALNTSTSLILLNQRFRVSHLREQVLQEKYLAAARKEFDYESLIELERSKPRHKKKTNSKNMLIDPYRHFEKKSRKKPKRSSSVNSRTESVVIKQAVCHEETVPISTLVEPSAQCYPDAQDTTKQNELDIQKPVVQRPSNDRLKSSGIRRKLPLTADQQLLLLDKHNIYDMKETKLRRSNSYSQTLNDRFKADFNCKPQYRLNDTQDYSKYAKFLPIPRSCTPNFIISKTPENKKPLTTNNIPKLFNMNGDKNPMSAVRCQESQ